MNLLRNLKILLIFFLATEVNTYRILGIFPLAFKSHNIFFQALMKVLAKSGHQVDVISHYEMTKPVENLTTILDLSKVDFPFPPNVFESLEDMRSVFQDAIRFLSQEFGTDICKLMDHQKLKDIIMNPPNDPPYDAVIVEGWAISCFYGIGYLWNVPTITATPSLEFPWISRQIGNPLSLAFFPQFLMPKAKIETFWDRLQNTIVSNILMYNFYSYTDKPQTELMRQILSPDMPTVREIERTVALSVVNTHFSVQGIRPLTPAFIEVGGLHIEEDDSSMSKSLQQWMDESKAGVVYISFGSIVFLESLPKEQILSLYSSFSKIAPVRVLMKARKGKTFPPGLPKNVKTMEWVPQIPVLRHNNTRVFITHGGVHSIQEAIYYGVPVIGVPYEYDQAPNIDSLRRKKMAIYINPDEITEKSMDKALNQILKNPKYREAAKNLSRIFKDRPMKPRKTAVFWIEYIIRNGAQSLRSPAVNMYWWQVDLLDVYGFLILCLVSVLYIIQVIIKIILKMCFKKNIKSELKRD